MCACDEEAPTKALSCPLIVVRQLKAFVCRFVVVLLALFATVTPTFESHDLYLLGSADGFVEALEKKKS